MEIKSNIEGKYIPLEVVERYKNLRYFETKTIIINDLVIKCEIKKDVKDNKQINCYFWGSKVGCPSMHHIGNVELKKYACFGNGNFYIKPNYKVDLNEVNGEDIDKIKSALPLIINKYNL